MKDPRDSLIVLKFNFPPVMRLKRVPSRELLASKRVFKIASRDPNASKTPPAALMIAADDSKKNSEMLIAPSKRASIAIKLSYIILTLTVIKPPIKKRENDI